MAEKEEGVLSALDTEKYIRKEVASGIPESSIRKELLKDGFEKDFIDKKFRKINFKRNLLMVAVAVVFVIVLAAGIIYGNKMVTEQAAQNLEKDSFLTGVISKGSDDSSCTKLSTAGFQKGCRLAMEEKAMLELPANTSGSAYPDKLLLRSAIINHDPASCNNIIDFSLKQYCSDKVYLDSIAKTVSDKSQCDQIVIGGIKELCYDIMYSNLARLNNDQSLCDKIVRSAVLKQNCLATPS